MTQIKTVYEAWTAVMHTVRAIEKSDRNQQQGFTFRGIDAVMDAVGPALREHGVSVIPTGMDLQSDSYATRSGTQMRNVTVTMQYTVYGPGGDSFTGVSFGEAADAGDKAVTKAQSVALRTFLLQSLMVPTGDADPDASTHERVVEQQKRKPVTPADKARDELLKLCNTYKLDVRKIAARFSDDYGLPIAEADVETVRAFTGVIADEIAVDEAAANG